MEKLSNEFKLSAMAAYMPCLAMYGKNGPYAIQGVSLSEEMAMFEWDEDSDWWNVNDDTVMILTPLSKITDEHAIEVARIIIPTCFINRKKGWKVSRDFTVTGYPYIKIHHPQKVWSVQIDTTLVNFDVDGLEDRATGSTNMQPASVIDFLRSHSYDCGFRNIPSLIAEGLAKEKI